MNPGECPFLGKDKDYLTYLMEHRHFPLNINIAPVFTVRLALPWGSVSPELFFDDLLSNIILCYVKLLHSFTNIKASESCESTAKSVQ